MPTKCLCCAEHQNNGQAILRGHAPFATDLRALACAPWYQRDISSIEIHVIREQPNSA
jgi:hypothetical protein